MASLILHDQQIINRLKRLARKQGRSIDEILDDFLRSVETQDPEENEETPGMKLARFAREANLVLPALPSDFDYDAFLNQEYGDELWRRMTGQSDDTKQNPDR